MIWNLLIAVDLQQALSQILLIISSKNYIKKYIDYKGFLEYEKVVGDSLNAENVAKQYLMKNQKKHLKIHFSFAKESYRFILLFCKIIYIQKMDSLKKFNESLWRNIESFYSNLNLKNVYKSDYNHEKNVWNNFWMKRFGCYYNL